jgi:membrane-associated phospholipid phosphatase
MKKMLKKIEIKPLLTTVSLIMIQTIMYFISKLFQGQPHLIGNFIDDAIPFNSLFIIPYFIWYALIFIVPYYAYLKDKKLFCKYIIYYFFITLFANIIFLFYPTMVIRPEIEVHNITTFMTSFIYAIDSPAINCFPSLHCAMSMLFILVICTCKKADNKFKIFIFFMSVLIMLSTLFTKQHVFIDLVSGDIEALLVFLIFKNEKKLVNKLQELLKL